MDITSDFVNTDTAPNTLQNLPYTALPQTLRLQSPPAFEVLVESFETVILVWMVISNRTVDFFLCIAEMNKIFKAGNFFLYLLGGGIHTENVN